MSDPTPEEKIAADPDPAAKNDVDGTSESAPADSGSTADAVDPGVRRDEEESQNGEIEALEAERDQFRDALQRLQADFENYRKRMTKQSLEGAERANESLVAKILPVLDTIELAQSHEPNSTVEQVHAALRDVLQKEGLERVIAVDAPFDPNEHDAVAHEPGEGEAKVSEELRAGYRWKGRVLRPAMVKVVG